MPISPHIPYDADAMTPDPMAFLQCPLDRQPLMRGIASVTCCRGHCYDIARGGYLNLLLPQHKRSREPGDGKEMVKSRRDFLNAGYYNPISDALNQSLYQALSVRDDDSLPPVVMDVACGDGFYLSRAASFLSTVHPKLLSFGIDISKFAIKAATQRSREITWIVGSSADLPIADRSLDVMLCTFFKVEFATFSSKLKANGRLILVVPQTNHLIELRQLIYDRVQHKDIDYVSQAAGQMTLQAQQDLSFQINIPDPVTLHNLFTMTPHYWRTNAQGRSRLAQQKQLTLTVDVAILTFIPRS